MFSLSRNYIFPIFVYVLVIFVITIMVRVFPAGVLFPVSAGIMFLSPFIAGSRVEGLRWNTRGVVVGLVLSFFMLAGYLLLVNKPFNLRAVSLSVVVFHLFFVSIPEEVFFRGYLQEKLGNNLRGVLFVSFLFALGHVATRCIGRGCSGYGYLEALLTFFPSVAMGYMYIISRTLWANILFHFLANIVYTSTGGL
ncbi:MAG: hypothetical protein KatS3mg078_1538 [Deltaproteobacteria bacterium]|nr:MAG: hypothetical protein KatS3mg078_1538 [Deltaproteobacteria bacterium]